jgi:hypothetical protein
MSSLSLMTLYYLNDVAPLSHVVCIVTTSLCGGGGGGGGGCNIPNPKGLGLLIIFLTCKDFHKVYQLNKTIIKIIHETLEYHIQKTKIFLLNKNMSPKQ